MSLSVFIKELNNEHRVEGELVKTVFYSLVSSFLILALLYFFQFRFIENFHSRYGMYLYLIILSYALLMPVLRQVRAYQELPCMSGMMVGMTAGMMAGFLSGFYIGATNGMFYGSVFGMGFGVLVGIWTGKCCGIMGVMEGIMAGFMSGLMGAMSSVMMLNDHLTAASFIIFVFCAAIIFSLNYMIYREMKDAERKLVEDHISTLALSSFLTLLTAWMMVLGPRGGILA